MDDAPAADDSMSPTITRDATRVGVILGTAAYMSPEQAKGKRVDRRTDIFAFGSLLYEILTGNKAFRGDGVSDVLAAVIKDEPNWDALPEGPFERVVRRCLAKPVTRRFQHVGDVRLELEEPIVAAAPGKAHRWGSLWVVVAVVVATAVALWAVFRAEAPEPKLVSRWRIPFEPGTTLWEARDGVIPAPYLALSPDGRHLAYAGERDGSVQLYLQAVGALDATPIEGAQNAKMPFFSADGQALGFQSASGNLIRVSLKGGAPVAISEAANDARGASWSLDGNITFGVSASGGLSRVPSAGGESEVLALPDRDRGIKALRLPDVLPGSEAVRVTVADLHVDSFDDSAIVAFWPTTGEMRTLVEGGTSARYSHSGHLVYARAGALYATPFDADDVEVTGDPVRVLDGVATYPTMGPASFSLSQEGSLLYAPGEPRLPQSRVVWVDRAGKATPLVDERRPFMDVTVSPDGGALIVSSNDANQSLWRYDLAQGTLTRIVSGGNNLAPVWAPDGARIAFVSDREGSYDVFSIAADGSGPLRRLVEAASANSWTPDGRTLLYSVGLDQSDIWLLTESGETVPVLTTTATEGYAQIAPNGRWMAYVSDESGRPEVYVCVFPDAASRRRVSIDGGTEPRWNPNGRELFYRDGNKMMAVDVNARDDFEPARPRLLFESDDYRTTGTGFSYDVSPDGDRFVMVDDSDSPRPVTELVLVQNWAEELKRLVPTDN